MSNAAIAKQLATTEATLIANAAKFRKAAGNGVFIVRPQSNRAKR